MTTTRIESLKRMLERNPNDTRIRFGLAMEYERLGRWEDAATELTSYLANADDEGNGWGRLGRALTEMGRDEEAREAYRRGVEAANRHGHPSMASELEDALDSLDAQDG